VNTVGVIPARLESSRLPGKILADVGGRPLLAHVYDAARAARSLDSVVVATDSERVREAASAFGARVVLTSPHLRSGTDRVAEAVRDLGAHVVVNLQGDEPFLEASVIDSTVAALVEDRDADIATAASPLEDEQIAREPSVVSVVRSLAGYALYFSRAPVPFYHARTSDRSTRVWLRHVGLYAYRREVLLAWAASPPTPLERAEDLEQLRALELGLRIRVVTVAAQWGGVDTADDLKRARAEWRRRHGEIGVVLPVEERA
jgi:3-deoxy-manno-octulosonate cytidylyltransferase (CMP-KDO synthetase)